MNDVHVRLRVGGETYAFPVEDVLEVADLGHIARVPGAGPDVLGVRNLRGEVLPVFDLASVLGIAREGAAHRLLVVEHGGHRAAFAIDDVLDVAELATPAEATDSRFLHGATLDNGTLVGVVDVARLFESLAESGA